MEKVYGRHSLTTKTISGVYANSNSSKSLLDDVKKVVEIDHERHQDIPVRGALVPKEAPRAQKGSKKVKTLTPFGRPF